MAVLVIADHDNATLKDNTHKVVTAAQAIGGDVDILVAGGKASGLKGGRHIRNAKPANLANLHLTLLDQVGVHLDSFVDSTGKVEDLFDRVDLA